MISAVLAVLLAASSIFGPSIGDAVHEEEFAILSAGLEAETEIGTPAFLKNRIILNEPNHVMCRGKFWDDNQILALIDFDSPVTTGGRDRHKMHHNMDVDILADEAQYRLIEIEKFADTIFRFRLGSKKRLWGFRIVNKFEILWYDPGHEIYPTDPH
ncbi:MAG: hypothetical protein ABI668_11285 [Sphingorhabdus sp.]